VTRRRADLLVVEQGLAATRTRAQALILAGSVLGPGERRIDKPGDMLDEATELHLKDQPLPYVSRGGLKLAGALDHFAIDVKGAVCADVGASTGGFTDCLLQRGAAKVYAIDVGYGQLAWQLQSDSRVVLIDRTNIRTMPPDTVPEKVTRVVIDVSFISLELVLAPALALAAPEVTLVALIKPQFEVGRGNVGKGGIVRDDDARAGAVEKVRAVVSGLGLEVLGVIDSPIVGAKGNREFLIAARR
jgi:23S rRNA (cytidine1920-2'-O)/16S rRNA (cytidine1409-2'-O)-methyltransferase